MKLEFQRCLSFFPSPKVEGAVLSVIINSIVVGWVGGVVMQYHSIGFVLESRQRKSRPSIVGMDYSALFLMSYLPCFFGEG